MDVIDGAITLVTGATGGIGHETVSQLARAGVHVIVHGRTQAEAETAVKALAKTTPADSLEPVWGDLSSMDEIHRLADQVIGLTDRLDVLVNNAAVFMPDRVLTPDGLETTFAVNHLAPFALTGLLQGLLMRSTPARVITVSSVAHFRGAVPLEDPSYERAYDPHRAYADSKLANVLFAFEASSRFAGSGVTSNTLHPGIIDTPLLRAGFPDRTGASPAVGATGIVYLVTSPDVEDVTGRYFVNLHPASAAPGTHDPELRERLWELSEDLTGVVFR